MLVKNTKDRMSNADPQLVATLYDDFLSLQKSAEHIQAERNENSSAMKGTLEADRRQQLIQRGQELKESLHKVEEALELAEIALQREGQRIPNLTHPSVPIGGEDLATVLNVVGSQRLFEGFEAMDHVTVAEALDLVDFEAAGEVSGQKFYYLRNAAALLELALVNWAMTKAAARGFTPIMTPDLVKASVLEKCGFQPRGSNTQVYSIQDSPLCLTGTAEVPLGGIYMDKVLNESDLPIKMAAFGHCFRSVLEASSRSSLHLWLMSANPPTSYLRTEAGASGAAGKGLYRVHQFSKVEMFVLSSPEQSDALHQELIDFETELYTDLGLHFKVLDMPSGDLGAPAYRKFDVEAWMPGLKRYGEISSASNCTDYQSRRLNIRYKRANAGGAGGKAQGKATDFVHTLNATACAVPRMIVAILENFQQADGSVVIPEVLRPFMGGMSIIKK